MKFRKKPIEIEAFQMTEAAFVSAIEWPEWAQDACEAGKLVMHGGGIACQIHTLEGVMDCRFDDWIIRGVAGEIYPCKPGIFETTYESVD